MLGINNMVCFQVFSNILHIQISHGLTVIDTRLFGESINERSDLCSEKLLVGGIHGLPTVPVIEITKFIRLVLHT